MGLDIYHVKPVESPPEKNAFDYFSMNELKEAPGYIKKYQHLFVPSPDTEADPSDALYFEVVSYQRKGMARDFFDHFENEKPYLSLSDVIFAYNFLNKKDEYFDENLKNFKENFIDNFVEGESIFCISY